MKSRRISPAFDTPPPITNTAGSHIAAIFASALPKISPNSFAISIAIYIPIFWIFAAGMILFFLSDLVLSMQYFGGKTQKSLIYINHILYYLAQICIAISIFYIS